MSINRTETAVRPDEAFASMKLAAERALQLDPLLAEAHAAMGGAGARPEVGRCRGGVPPRRRAERESLVDPSELRPVHALAAGRSTSP